MGMHDDLYDKIEEDFIDHNEEVEDDDMDIKDNDLVLITDRMFHWLTKYKEILELIIDDGSTFETDMLLEEAERNLEYYIDRWKDIT